jgi:hypothetical protein
MRWNGRAGSFSSIFAITAPRPGRTSCRIQVMTADVLAFADQYGLDRFHLDRLARGA